VDVINRGFGGYNTEWLLPVLQQQIIPSVFNVVLWIILIGANDAMLAPGLNHVPSFATLANSGSN
jgi:isoamyl acetate esterase